ncbi:MAG: hypothetical protein GWN81_09070 [Phycisphaerae bacterium]|nr:hypothetical protein [Phycisphaerae bacterium]NIU08982.1 hypothetical protein [Phycisphaerae bacterium]NIW91814.1 hypothetical protein [Phycisphaerae bacterium]
MSGCGGVDSNSMGNENILVGYFLGCQTCKASFIRLVAQGFSVTHEGRIYLKEGGRAGAGADEGGFVEAVRCPCCLSGDVRSVEIGDKKW